MSSLGQDAKFFGYWFALQYKEIGNIKSALDLTFVYIKGVIYYVMTKGHNDVFDLVSGKHSDI